MRLIARLRSVTCMVSPLCSAARRLGMEPLPAAAAPIAAALRNCPSVLLLPHAVGRLSSRVDTAVRDVLCSPCLCQRRCSLKGSGAAASDPPHGDLAMRVPADQCLHGASSQCPHGVVVAVQGRRRGAEQTRAADARPPPPDQLRKREHTPCQPQGSQPCTTGSSRPSSCSNPLRVLVDNMAAHDDCVQHET